MDRAAILVYGGNSREDTVKCLSAVSNQAAVLSSAGLCSSDIFFFDSFTGESPAIIFPQVTIVKGEEGTSRNRGLRTLWEKAGGDYDFYIWLMAGVILRDNALATLLDISLHLGNRAIVAGSVAPDLFGGRILKKSRLMTPDRDIPVPCEIFDGALALVPSAVYSAIGMNDPYFRYAFWDYDYALKAFRAGFDSVLAPGILADAPGENPPADDYSLQGYANERFVFDTRSRGIPYAIAHFFKHSLIRK